MHAYLDQIFLILRESQKRFEEEKMSINFIAKKWTLLIKEFYEENL